MSAFEGLAASTATGFCSRNSDIRGYWAMGYLLQVSLEIGQYESVIDLLSEDASEHFQRPLMRCLPQRARDIFSRTRLGQRHLRHAESIVEARLSVQFLCSEKARGQYPLTMTRYVCGVKIIGNEGRGAASEYSGACFAHNPALENRSARATEQEKLQELREVLAAIYAHNMPADYGLFLISRMAYCDSCAAARDIAPIFHKRQLAVIARDYGRLGQLDEELRTLAERTLANRGTD